MEEGEDEAGCDTLAEIGKRRWDEKGETRKDKRAGCAASSVVCVCA